MEYLQYFNNINGNWTCINFVLNLVISGIPSILKPETLEQIKNISFVLNLVISGIPSIQMKTERKWED